MLSDFVATVTVNCDPGHFFKRVLGSHCFHPRETVPHQSSQPAKDAPGSSTHFITYAADMTCVYLGQRGFPQCISPWPAGAAAMTESNN